MEGYVLPSSIDRYIGTLCLYVTKQIEAAITAIMNSSK